MSALPPLRKQSRFKSVVDVAIIGAGPYGLSLAAHLNARGVEFRIFGTPMQFWRESMPPGMALKSFPWASNLTEPEGRFSVKEFCTSSGILYHDTLVPLALETFQSYAQAFQARFAPQVELAHVVSLKQTAGGFCAVLDDGEVVEARRIVVAAGLTHFQYLPPIASRFPAEAISHSSLYGSLHGLAGKRVAVVGAGSSATDLAALLHQRGASAALVVRGKHLKFAARPRYRGTIERTIVPMAGIGNGWPAAFCAWAPDVVKLLPGRVRMRLANGKAYGPLGSAFSRERIVGNVRLLLGREIHEVTTHGGEIDLRLIATDGAEDVLRVDHVVFATGYRADVRRLAFLDPVLTGQMRAAAGVPLLSRHYESSIDGLHFIGPISANSFGPVTRFLFGAGHAARHLARCLPETLGRRLVPVVGTRRVEPAVAQ